MVYSADELLKIEKLAVPFDDNAYTVLLEKIGDAQVVLLGEATHGTHEFYEIRAEITKKLIKEKQFNVIAIEGDWPDAYQINRYLHQEEYSTAYEAVSSFDRFPTWMWQNIPMVNLIEWLYHHNAKSENKVSFYGMDLYSLYRSIGTIIEYLEKIDPKLAQEAAQSYACLDRFNQDPQRYAYAVFSRVTKSCKDEVIAELKKLEALEWQLVKDNKATAQDAFYITQNARVIKNSESYYRSLFINEVNNWNLRDTHMMETVEQIINFHKNQRQNSKIIIWAHNSHIGNAAATQMSTRGELNIGQLAKEKYGGRAFNLGFTTYNGTVSAASDWHGPVERKIVRDALSGSYEDLFHSVGIPEFLLAFEDKNSVPKKLLERAIGVIYAPQSERMSHYFYASLADQFDAVIHYDTTTALEPLEKTKLWIEGEVPETYPTGY